MLGDKTRAQYGEGVVAREGREGTEIKSGFLPNTIMPATSNSMLIPMETFMEGAPRASRGTTMIRSERRR